MLRRCAHPIDVDYIRSHDATLPVRSRLRSPLQRVGLHESVERARADVHINNAESAHD